MIRLLSDLRARDAATYGSKAANLGELLSIGCVVPDGFVVLVDEREYHQSGDPSNRPPRPIVMRQQEIFDAFDSLGCSLAAVRSSATVEDSVEASYAGIFQTVLNVPRQDLLDSCQKCLDSVFHMRVRSYQEHRNLGSAAFVMPVIIQRMLKPELSGVCFTKHPVTGNERESLIEVVCGLGEPVVSGMVTPDSYLFDHDIGRITSAKAGSSRGVDDSLDTELLSKKRRILVAQIANACIPIHQHFGRAQDVEFAVEANIIYFLQARPVTNSNADEREEV